jgi:hypothetical protein
MFIMSFEAKTPCQRQTTVFWAALGAGKAFTIAVGRIPDGRLQARVWRKIGVEPPRHPA